MRARFLASLFALLAAAFAVPAAAAPSDWVTPPKKLPHVQHGDATHNLDFLFGALKVAPDDVTAKAIEERIWALWTATRSDTTVAADVARADRDRGERSRSRDQAARCRHQDQTEIRRSLEPARHHLLHEKGLRPRARRHSRGAAPRAAPFRRAVGPRPDHAGNRRRQAGAGSLSAARLRSIRACRASPTSSRRCRKRSRAGIFNPPPPRSPT